MPLPPKPFAVLAHLVEHAGQVVTKDALLEAVWPETAVSEGVLKTCMGQIRQALGDMARTPQFIETVYRRGYRFIAPVTAEEPLRPVSEVSFPPATRDQQTRARSVVSALIDREAELGALHQCWRDILQGRRQIVFVTGEAGIGKTALVDAFIAQITSTGVMWTACGQCIEQYGAGEAYLPLLDALGQLGRGRDGAQVVACLCRQAPSWLLQMPALWPNGAYDMLQQRRASTTRASMLRELAEAMEALTAEYPLVLVLEDLHWSDYATLDWLTFMARHRTPARLLVLGTYRPADAVVRAHPVYAAAQELRRQGQAIELGLHALSNSAVQAYVTQRFGTASLPAALPRILRQRTNGNPFFLVTVVDELIRQGLIDTTESDVLPRVDVGAIARCVPESARQLIDQQLAQLSPEALELLEAASVAGTEFSAAAVAAGTGHETDDIERCCDTLGRRGQFIQPCDVTEWPDGTVAARYRFIHELYCAIVYDRVPASRRVRWHRQIGARLETAYGAQAPTFAAELAMHFVRGRDGLRAVTYLRYAGEQALRRSAHQEAVMHLTQGLEWLRALPDHGERVEQELILQTALGPALVATRGWLAPEVEQTYVRAHELCRQLGEPPQTFPVLYGLYELYEYRGAFQTSREFGEQLLHLARGKADATLLIGSHETLACTLFHLGGFASVLEQTEQGLSLYHPHQHQDLIALYGRDLGIACRYWHAMALWFQGEVDRAIACIEEAMMLARNLAHPYSLAAVLCRGALLRQCRRESWAAYQWADEAIALADAHGFPSHAAMGAILRGWALAMNGRAVEGIDQIQQGLATLRTLGREMDRPYFLGLLAEAYAQSGQFDSGLNAVEEALTAIRHDRDFFFAAELYRLRGMLSYRTACAEQHAHVTPENDYQMALDIARRQQARALELRSATSLAQYWQERGKGEKAGKLLADVYSTFSEGFDTDDLREARSLLGDFTSTDA